MQIPQRRKRWKGKGRGKGGENGKGKAAKKGRDRIPAVPYVEGTPFTGNCFYCNKPGHRIQDCNASKNMRKNDVFIAKFMQYLGDEAEQLVLLLNAAGTFTCETCYNPNCYGQGQCNPDNIYANMQNTAAKFLNDGLKTMAIENKRTSSYGIQRTRTPSDFEQVLLSQTEQESSFTEGHHTHTPFPYDTSSWESPFHQGPPPQQSDWQDEYFDQWDQYDKGSYHYENEPYQYERQQFPPEGDYDLAGYWDPPTYEETQEEDVFMVEDQPYDEPTPPPQSSSPDPWDQDNMVDPPTPERADQDHAESWN